MNDVNASGPRYRQPDVPSALSFWNFDGGEGLVGEGEQRISRRRERDSWEAGLPCPKVSAQACKSLPGRRDFGAEGLFARDPRKGAPTGVPAPHPTPRLCRCGIYNRSKLIII